MIKKFANIIVDISHENLDRTFQYKIPDELVNRIHPGVQVLIPFGKSNRLIKGYVLELTDICEFDIEKIKKIDSVEKGSLQIESQLILLASWIKENYGSTMNQALKTVIPVKQKVNPKKKKWIRLILEKQEFEDYLEKYKQSKKYLSRYNLLNEFLQQEILDFDIVVGKMGVSPAVINSMAESNIIEITTEYFLRNPVKNTMDILDDFIHTDEQKKIIQDINSDILEGKTNPHLIFGITGSGKTEIYIQLIKRTIMNGRQAILLIPEIALVYQTLKRFYNVFGDRVSVINSKMSQGERHDQFERAKRGEIDIIIGPRSALFTPFTNLGLIIIDEEQEATYKSENVPKYHARETAIERARISNATVILGSATPSVESYYKAMSGEFRIHYLTKRTNRSFLPEVHVVDLREELKNGNRTIFSEKLDSLIKDRLEKQQQIMLFINRRGYSGFMSCRACGFAMKCPHCDVGLTVHNNGTLMCHYCGYKISVPKTCPSCGSKHIAAFGTGTQKIESFVKETYPLAKVLRMDMDTTSKKDDYEKILSKFSNREADILIGTQMIVKGHDFPYVTLVGIIAADLSLYAGDYKASERTFQLITQAAGRAGRGESAGEVVIQTYSTDNYSIVTSAAQDYDAFYEKEILYRKLMSYPPVVNMVAILIASKDEKKLKDAVKNISDIIDISNFDEIMKIGPTDAAMSKINDLYRKVVYIKHSDNEVLIKLKDNIENHIKENKEHFSSIIVQFDFSPIGNY